MPVAFGGKKRGDEREEGGILCIEEVTLCMLRQSGEKKGGEKRGRKRLPLCY